MKSPNGTSTQSYYVRGAENINEYLEAFNSIYCTLSPEEKKWFGKLSVNTIQAGVILAANNMPMAVVMLHRFARMYKDYFWISCATNKNMRGRGLTKRLFEECKTIAKSFDAKVLHWYCDPNNIASNKMAEKLGFQKRHKYRPNDRNQYSYYLSESANPDANAIAGKTSIPEHCNGSPTQKSFTKIQEKAILPTRKSAQATKSRRK